jgi:16S rRNA (cytosine967-C5)-methyltransferase
VCDTARRGFYNLPMNEQTARAKSAKPHTFSAALPADSLARSVYCAAQCVAAVAGGASLTHAIAQVNAQYSLPAAQRGAVQDLAFYTLRRYRLASALAEALLHRAPDAQVAALLHVALALLSETQTPKYATHTAVDQTVRAAQALPEGQRIKALINGVLRSFLRERDALLAQALQDPQARWNLPRWWIARLKRAYPQQWQQIAQSAQEPPPLILRANARVNSPARLIARLSEAGVQARLGKHDAVFVDPPRPITGLPGYAEGAFSVQDAGAQLAAPLLAVQDGARVLDACAAPGGKTAHLLELAGCYVTALDVDAQRLARVSENLQRLRLAANIRCGDAAHPAIWWDGVPFDAILLDAPCSASGIVRRHPDIAWLRREADVAHLAATQRALLDALWPLLKVGGRLLYVTCSVFPEEGEQQASAFVQRMANVRRLNAPGQLLPTAGERDNHDGFFYALFAKHA